MNDYVLEISCVASCNIVHCEIIANTKTNSQGYGGCKYEEASYCHPAVDRAFEVVMVRILEHGISDHSC